jgi:hypothetical protein
MPLFTVFRKATAILVVTLLFGIGQVSAIDARAGDDVCGFGYVHYDDDYNADYENGYSFLDEGFCEKIEWEYLRLRDAFSDTAYLSIDADEIYFESGFKNITTLTFACSVKHGLMGWLESDPIGIYPNDRRGRIQYRVDRGPIRTTTYTRSPSLESAYLDNPKDLSRAIFGAKKTLAIQIGSRVATFPRSNLNSVRKKFSGNCRLG